MVGGRRLMKRGVTKEGEEERKKARKPERARMDFSRVGNRDKRPHHHRTGDLSTPTAQLFFPLSILSQKSTVPGRYGIESTYDRAVPTVRTDTCHASTAIHATPCHAPSFPHPSPFLLPSRPSVRFTGRCGISLPADQSIDQSINQSINQPHPAAQHAHPITTHPHRPPSSSSSSDPISFKARRHAKPDPQTSPDRTIDMFPGWETPKYSRHPIDRCTDDAAAKVLGE